MRIMTMYLALMAVLFAVPLLRGETPPTPAPPPITAPATVPAAATEPAIDHTHARWQTVLTANVKDGLFNYQALKANRTEFDAYLAELASVSKDDVAGWTREQQLAYYINAYNAYTVESILAHYPLKRNGLTGLAYPANSIRQISGVWDTVTHRVAGEDLTLDQIEHQRLRAQLKEPRIHFAVNCASIGCPPLPATAYTAADVDAQLTTAAHDFATNSRYVRFDVAPNTLTLSKILDWFNDDFKGTKGTAAGFGDYTGAVNFLMVYWAPATKRAVLAQRPKVVFADYDWTLNEWK